MKKKKRDKPLEDALVDYIAFLTKRLASENYKRNVSQEEYAKCKDKLDRARFRLKMLKPVSRTGKNHRRANGCG